MMDRREIAERVRVSRGTMISSLPASRLNRDEAAEGGCGVIGIACSERIPGRHLLQSLRQMRNRGNGKGGGAVVVGLDPEQFGVGEETLRECYLLTVGYLDESARPEVERQYIEPGFEVDHIHELPLRAPADLEPKPPKVVVYFSRVKEATRRAFAEEAGLEGATAEAVEEEWVYQNSYRLSSTFYASLGEQQAFVLSHGKDMLAAKAVSYGDDVIEIYGLDELRGHVWIGHHRYPTKGRVWHPGGAHPFVGMHEALVHNGDFANYASVCSYLAQHNIRPLFLTDTEVSVQVFDLLHRTFNYPMEYVIEGLAPTTERDFHMLPKDKQRVYRMLQTVHMHGSPDGPWFFLIGQSVKAGNGPRTARLLGITDTSMLRPQVFALQRGAPGQPSIGFAASEKQAIDGALLSLSKEDPRFWSRPDKIWVARGGSHTDGGAFLFDVQRSEAGDPELICRDKFGREIDFEHDSKPYQARGDEANGVHSPLAVADRSAAEIFEAVEADLPSWDYGQFHAFLDQVTRLAVDDEGRDRAFKLLALLLDRRYRTGQLRRSSLLARCDLALGEVVDSVLAAPSPCYSGWRHGQKLPGTAASDGSLVIDARGFAPEGPGSLARAVVAAVKEGHRRLLIARTTGQRFVANGLGRAGSGIRIDVFGSPGDYLASGLDGAEVVLHNNGQDQLAQIMRDGKLVVHGDVGQTFMYAAKGGRAFVLGSAAGRPLINGVGSPRVVINGTCLDYLAESFMAGDPLDGGGFAILNGVGFRDDGTLQEMETPYPGGNLFSLASGGAIFLRDPRERVGRDQLNGGAFTPFRQDHWSLIEPLLQENERLFGIGVDQLLTVDGELREPGEVYRAIIPVREKALMPEEAWVAHEG